MKTKNIIFALIVTLVGSLAHTILFKKPAAQKEDSSISEQTIGTGIITTIADGLDVGRVNL